MANRWTGDFDAVIEIAPSGLNALLAVIHRKGDPLPNTPSTGPHFLHSFALNLPLPGTTSERNLRGHVQVQVSTPSVRVPAGPEGRVAVSVMLYAWFQNAFGSEPGPEFVHGTLEFTTGVEVIECVGNTLAEVRVASADVAVDFTPAPGAGLSASDVSLVEEVIADFLRSQLKPVHLRIASLGSGDFTVEHFAFKTLRTSSRSALAALLGFSAGGAPGPAGVSEIFLESGDDLGLALGREFLVDTLRDLAQGPLGGIEVSGSRLGVDFTAAPDPASLSLQLRQGTLRAQLGGTGALSPGGSFEFLLTQDFGMTVSAGDVVLTLADEPQLEITEGNPFLKFVFFIFKGRILDKLQQAASGLIQVANSELNQIVDKSVGDLLTELDVPGVTVELEHATIDPDAVLLGGSVDIGPTKPVLPGFTNQIERPPGLPTLDAIETKYDALESWIPGGTITRYRWVQIRADGSIAQTITEEHRFVLRLQPVVTTMSQAFGWPPYTWCLEVQGTQFVDALDPVPVSGAVCGLSVIVPGIDLPRAPGRLIVHVPDGRGGTLADLDPWGRYRPHAFAESSENRGALLVHLACDALAESVKILREVLVEKNRELLLFPTVIVPGEKHGYACGSPMRELAELALTNDPEGEWRERFRLERPGTTVIVGPGGRELWRDTGPLSAEVLEKVVAGLQLEEANTPRWTPVKLKLSQGAFAPDLFLPCGPQVALMEMSKMRGREVQLCFWTTWSAASLEELRRCAAAATENGLLVLAVNDGEDPALAAEVLKREGLELRLVTDPERRIARQYGVSCWPTVVNVDAQGRITTVRFGLEPELARNGHGARGENY